MFVHPADKKVFELIISYQVEEKARGTVFVTSLQDLGHIVGCCQALFRIPGHEMKSFRIGLPARSYPVMMIPISHTCIHIHQNIVCQTLRVQQFFVGRI